MNLIVLFADDFIAGSSRVRLTGRRAHHVYGIHHAQPGKQLRVGLWQGLLGRGLVTRCTPEILEMEVTLADKPPAPLPITLIMALPRPKVLKRVIQGVVAMGIKNMVLLKTWRVEKSYWQSPLLAEKSLNEQVLLGLEQAGDTVPPQILLRSRFKPFMEDELPLFIAGTVPMLALPAAELNVPARGQRSISLFIGPEGGLVAYEIEVLREVGFATVSLGPRILRVEQAVPALLGRLL
ncbi:MAG: 16S rRNA (uracil(1498)-N(3))-methyltransferase [Deltaproteobacteria bacterium]|nr:16S rRNA (uracil(1498)-N(3))-methyltransferase [Candidatus Anaeroferrophillus wilburensis]MBN2888990.1 16S rRNA (uracil(1498)-N(3))-methyltransferase [Deltaproteobacteria bacterium]